MTSSPLPECWRAVGLQLLCLDVLTDRLLQVMQNKAKRVIAAGGGGGTPSNSFAKYEDRYRPEPRRLHYTIHHNHVLLQRLYHA